MAIVNNPFIVGGYLSPHYFCDREVETEQLIRNQWKKCRYHFCASHGKDRSDSSLLLSG